MQIRELVLYGNNGKMRRLSFALGQVNIITGIRNTFQSMRRSAIIWQREFADLIIQVDCKDVDIVGNKEEARKCIEAGYDSAMATFSDRLKIAK